MSDNPSTLISKNDIGGSVILGDQNNLVMPEKKTALRCLIENLRLDENLDDIDLKFIEELQNYMRQMKNAPRDLGTKLRDGERKMEVDDAENLKEKFEKKLYRNAFSKQTQEVFAHILAYIHSRFNMTIKPLILAGVQISEVDNKVYLDIIESIYEDVRGSPLIITQADIRGMLYYLAANCYIDWDKQ